MPPEAAWMEVRVFVRIVCAARGGVDGSPGFREDCLCRQGRHEWKVERRSFSNIELMSAS